MTTTCGCCPEWCDVPRPARHSRPQTDRPGESHSPYSTRNLLREAAIILRMGPDHVVELSERLTYWTEPHPNWRLNLEWPEEVGCVIYVASDVLVLIDPLIRDDLSPSAWDWLDRAVEEADGHVAVLLTAPWHERSTRSVVNRYAAEVWIDPGARERISDLPRLRTIPAGIDVFTPRGVSEGQVAFFIEEERTLIVAEFFLRTRTGLRLCQSPATCEIGEFTESLDELRRLPIDRVLIAHGQPILEGGADAIAAALDYFAQDHRA